MSYDLTDDQRAFQETARRFAREKLAPGYQRREVEGRIDRALVREMGNLGLIAPELPEQMGGLGAPSLTSGLIAEAIGYADINAAYIQILRLAERQDHRRSCVSRACPAVAAPSCFRRCHRGDRAHRTARRLGCRQPAPARRARRRPLRHQWREDLDLGRPGRRGVVFGRTGTREIGAHGVSALLVPMDLPGVTRSASTATAAAIGRGSIFFENVVFRGEPSGDENKGFVQVMQGFDFSRALIGLQVLAVARVRARGDLGVRGAARGVRQAAVGLPGRVASAGRFRHAGRGGAPAVPADAVAQGRGAPHSAEAAMCKWWAPKTRLRRRSTSAC